MQADEHHNMFSDQTEADEHYLFVPPYDCKYQAEGHAIAVTLGYTLQYAAKTTESVRSFSLLLAASKRLARNINECTNVDKFIVFKRHSQEAANLTRRLHLEMLCILNMWPNFHSLQWTGKKRFAGPALEWLRKKNICVDCS